MNFRTTIVLLVLVIAAGWFYVEFVKDEPAVEVDKPDGGSKLLFSDEDFDADNIEKITIERNGKSIVIEKDGADWIQTAPVRFAVNSWSGGQFGTNAKSLKYTEKFKPGKGDQPALGAIGLEPPKATISLVADDKTITLRVGKKLAIGSRGYLTINDDEHVYIVDDGLHELLLDKSIKDWRKKSLAGPKEPGSQRVTLTRDGETIELVKADGNWAFGGSHSGRVATQAVADLIGKLDNMYVKEFSVDQPDDLTVYGLTSPRTVLRIEPSTASTQPANSQPAPKATVFSIGGPKDLKDEQFYAALSEGDQPADIVFVIGKTDKEKFDADPDDLRDKRITLIKATDVNTIELTRGDKSLKLERSDAGWAFAEPAPPFNPDGGLLGDLLDKVEDIEAESFVAHAKPQAALATVTLIASGRAEPDVLKIHEHADGQHLVLRNNETTGHVVPGDKLALLLKSATAFRDRTIVELKIDELSSVSITRPDGVNFQFDRDETTWRLAGHDKFESADLDALLVFFQPMLAETWPDDGKIGKSAYTVQLGDKTKLTIDSESRAGAADGIDGVFQISQSMLDSLGVEYRHRTLFDFTADDIQQVAVGEITITKKDSDYTSEQTDKLDDSAAGGVFDTLAGLRVERYVAATQGANATRTIDITLKDGDAKLALQLSADHTASTGDRWFELSEDDYDKLMADLIKAE